MNIKHFFQNQSVLGQFNVKSLLRFFPFMQWLPKLTRDSLRPDMEAGLISAVLILPQSIALATLAGMPPEYGIYTSIFPVIIASFWGSSWHALSGPNTAVCVMIAYSVAPFANVGDAYYIGFVLALTFMVGVIQFSLGLFKLGAILDFISNTVISAIILAVAFVMIVSAFGDFFGVLTNLDEPFFIKLYQIFNNLPNSNIFTIIIGTVTVATGIIVRRYNRRYALVYAVLSGTIIALLLNTFFGSANTDIKMVGYLSLSLLPISTPTFNLESMYVLNQLVSSAFAIAFLGLMQTVLIARSIAEKSGQRIDTNQEIIGQGVSNLVAPFLSSFASSGSFNRSAAHYESGAKTPMAALYASIMLAIAAIAATSLIAYIPMAAVSGVLILVGYSLIDPTTIKKALCSRQESIIFFITFTTALGFGLNAGVFIGLMLSLIVYLWYASTPNIVVKTHFGPDDKPVTVVTIDGNLFFGSVRHIEREFAKIGRPQEHSRILLRTDHITYMDIPGAEIILSELISRRKKNDEMYLYVTRSNVVSVLRSTGCLEQFGEEHVIVRGLHHPMESLLYPTRNEKIIYPKNIGIDQRERIMKSLAKILRNTRLLGPLDTDQIEELLEQREILSADAGDILFKESDHVADHLVLLEGELEAQITWSTENGNDKSYTRIIKPEESESNIGLLCAANRIRVRALSNVRYILIDADKVDLMLGWSQQFSEDMKNDPELQRRINLFKHVSVFHKLPLENLTAAFACMYDKIVSAGETVIEQGEAGDSYYVIDSGEAEVIRTDPFTDEVDNSVKLGPGDAFGEEALIQNAYRNATIMMTTPGKLLVLDKEDFDSLLKPHIVEEIAAKEAYDLLKQDKAKLIDCRYDIEHEESRIPDSPLYSLDQLRWNAKKLNPDEKYIVYCRSGRRSKAAAYILRERNIDAVSLVGGIKEWPYEIDSTLLN